MSVEEKVVTEVQEFFDSVPTSGERDISPEEEAQKLDPIEPSPVRDPQPEYSHDEAKFDELSNDIKRIKILEAILVRLGVDVEAIDYSSDDVGYIPMIAHQAEVSSPEAVGLSDASVDSLKKLFTRLRNMFEEHDLVIDYENLHLWTMASKARITTMSTAILETFIGSGRKSKVDVIKNLTGRIRTGKLTLVIGPPGCGKTTFLQLLSGRLEVGSSTLEGDLLYNGEKSDPSKFLLAKLMDYISQDDVHAPTLTVSETMEFAWRCTTGGHHSYAFAKSPEIAKEMDSFDDNLAKVNLMCH